MIVLCMCVRERVSERLRDSKKERREQESEERVKVVFVVVVCFFHLVCKL